jgi:isopentenyl diphosphate isomerase/L-lactate dehydrogenase-like FMN-dependent dehydrogenase
MGARAVGLGRAALLAANESDDGLVNLVTGIELEMRMLVSALGKYIPAALSTEDVLLSANSEQHRA